MSPNAYAGAGRFGTASGARRFAPMEQPLAWRAARHLLAPNLPSLRVLDEMSGLAFRPLIASDLPMLHEWLCRPHVAEWWEGVTTYADVEGDFLPYFDADSLVRACIVQLDGQPIGFIQSYVVMGSAGGWWEQETDPGARGIDQFLANAEQLGQGLGSAMIWKFVDGLFADPAVTKVQTDPSPRNERAIRCYRRAGFMPMGEVTTPDGAALFMICTRAEHLAAKTQP